MAGLTTDPASSSSQTFSTFTISTDLRTGTSFLSSFLYGGFISKLINQQFGCSQRPLSLQCRNKEESRYKTKRGLLQNPRMRCTWFVASFRNLHSIFSCRGGSSWLLHLCWDSALYGLSASWFDGRFELLFNVWSCSRLSLVERRRSLQSIQTRTHSPAVIGLNPGVQPLSKLRGQQSNTTRLRAWNAPDLVTPNNPHICYSPLLQHWRLPRSFGYEVLAHLAAQATISTRASPSPELLYWVPKGRGYLLLPA